MGAVFGIDKTVVGNLQVVRAVRDAIEEKVTLFVGEEEIGKGASGVCLKTALGLFEGFAIIEAEHVTGNDGIFFRNINTRRGRLWNR